MPGDKRPILSVIVRRFRTEHEPEIERSVTRIERAVAGQPGFVGIQNSLSHGEDESELVTVFAFETRESLERWQTSPLRARLVADLDRHTHDTTAHTQFGDLALLLHPGAKLRKIETVVILIFWIFLIGFPLRSLADMHLPGTLAPWLRDLMLITVSVLLISYLFLPWSSMALTRLKERLSRRPGR